MTALNNMEAAQVGEEALNWVAVREQIIFAPTLEEALSFEQKTGKKSEYHKEGPPPKNRDIQISASSWRIFSVT